MTTRAWTIGVIAAAGVASGGLAGAVTASTGPPRSPAVGYVLQARLNRSQMVPAPAAPVSALASGHFQALLAQVPISPRPSGGSFVWKLGWRLTVSSLSGPVTKVEIGQGARGSVGSKLVMLCSPCSRALRGVVHLTGAKAKALLAKSAYVTASTAVNSGGEIRGQVSRPGGTGPRGWIAGSIVRNPGGDPRSGGGNGSTVPVSGDSIAAGLLAGPTIAVAVSAQDGSFRLSLPAGTYRVVEGICGVSAQATVESGTTVNVTLTVPNAC